MSEPSLTKSVSVEACPSCESMNFLVTGTQASGFAVSGDGREFIQPPYTILECSVCGLLYKNNTASHTELENYYAKISYRKWEIETFYPTERAVLSILRNLPKHSRILDFGCSSGRLLAPLIADYECCGFEINADAAKVAELKGLKMLASDFLKPSLTQALDAIVLVDVFEHLPAPTKTLREIIALLKPGGILVLVTGNGDHWSCRRDPALFWYFRNIEHTCMITHKYAQWVSTQMGASIKAWTKCSHYDVGIRGQLFQKSAEFAYFQFKRGTLFAKYILNWIPVIRRARLWSLPPSCGWRKDHIVAVFKKS